MRVVIATVLYLFLGVLSQDQVNSETKTLTPDESSKALSDEGHDGDFILANFVVGGVPPDNGGNYGDLIFRYRENRDRLLLREVVISQPLASVEQDLHWSVSLAGSRISSVRVMNIGRERAYCMRIDAAGGDVQAIIRIPPLYDPRVMIEIYGY